MDKCLVWPDLLSSLGGGCTFARPLGTGSSRVGRTSKYAPFRMSEVLASGAYSAQHTDVCVVLRMYCCAAKNTRSKAVHRVCLLDVSPSIWFGLAASRRRAAPGAAQDKTLPYTIAKPTVFIHRSAPKSPSTASTASTLVLKSLSFIPQEGVSYHSLTPVGRSVP